MAKYTVVSPVKYAGKRYEIGGIIESSDKALAQEKVKGLTIPIEDQEKYCAEMVAAGFIEPRKAKSGAGGGGQGEGNA